MTEYISGGVSMELRLTMDTKVMPEHVISAGEFEVEFDDNRVFRFDFARSCRTASGCDPDKNKLSIYLWDIDKPFLFDVDELSDHLVNRKIIKLNEVYVYTGEPYDRPISVASIDDMTFFTQGISIKVPENLLKEYQRHTDDDLLCEAGDRIDNAVFDAIKALAVDELDWDMHHIGEVTDLIEEYLIDNGIDICHPWQDKDENICYSTNGRCLHCKKGQEK